MKVSLEERITNKNFSDVLVFVTDTVWGLGCLPNDKKSVDKIYEMKGRDRSKPLILMSNSIENLLPYVKDFPKKAKDLAEKYLPGALTLVLKKSDLTPDFITSNKDTIGIRIPDNPIFQSLCEKIPGHVLATTSANFSGQPPVKNYEEAFKLFSSQTEYIFEDEGFVPKGKPSAVVGIFDGETKIFREGSISKSEISG